MKISRKKIVLIWDFDGAIGQINSTYPYNFALAPIYQELDNVKMILDILGEAGIKCCFAITGFTAEEGVYPYVCPDLIRQIRKSGHEIASHSWRHEWIPIFAKKQIEKSIIRSKSALEKCIGETNSVLGFVPPHSRPMTWLKRGAISIGDRGIFPFSKTGDLGILVNMLMKNGYRWMRYSHQNLLQKFRLLKRNRSGHFFIKNGFLFLENFYVGFDQSVIDYILNSNSCSFTITAHPQMLSKENKSESLPNFINFVKKLTCQSAVVEFVTPQDILFTSISEKKLK